jgi:hypothetical protein
MHSVYTRQSNSHMYSVYTRQIVIVIVICTLSIVTVTER